MHWSWIAAHRGAQIQNRENNPMQSRMGPGSQRSCGLRPAGATSASKMSRSRRQKGGCEAAFFMPAFGHRLSFRRVATNHHPLSKFNIERESF